MTSPLPVMTGRPLPMTAWRWVALVIGTPLALLAIGYTALTAVAFAGLGSYQINLATPVAGRTAAVNVDSGDVTVRKLVTAIKSSKAWRGDDRRSAIVVLWDENDYSTAPNTNQVMLIVDTNYGTHGVVSTKRYNHFSLLKSIESGLGLPCLNHACDANVDVMSDLFAEGQRR